MLRVISLAAAASALIATACSGQTKPPARDDTPVVVDYDAEAVLKLTGIGNAGTAPYYEAASYDPAITAPEAILGHPLGARPAAPDRIVACFQRWAEQSPRIQVKTYAVSYEGRELIRAVISTPDNLQRLDDIKADIGKLADPRGLAATEAARIVQNTPAIGWFAYSIHGDELSGSDAALAFAYHLVADNTESVTSLLRDTVVIVDPVMNPDGRQRTLNTTDEMRSRVPNDNYTSIERERWWPGGRGNHYFFDLNRDWIIGVHPETRGRWSEFFQFHPQLLIDAHEMGSLDTYLFSPKNKPYNPGFPDQQFKWYDVFSRDLAAAFDRKGWAYYTREWSDGWFPGYSSTWGPINGAIGFLYEQSAAQGLAVRRPSGTRVTYRESIAGHAVSSLVNLASLAKNREAVLSDYLAANRDAVNQTGRAFVIKRGAAPDREHHLVTVLMRQGVEVHETTAALVARGARSGLGEDGQTVELPAGTYVIYSAQPQGRLVRALLDYDLRVDDDTLARERAELERNGRTRLYDMTAWNLAQAFALDAYWIPNPRVGVRKLTALPETPVGVQPAPADQPGLGGRPVTQPANETAQPYAWLVDARWDASTRFAAHAMDDGLTVHVADEAFDTGGREFARGSVLVRRSENPPDVAERVAKVASSASAPVYTTRSGRAPGDSIDLGGRHFHRLDRPRVALLANSPIRSNEFGHTWHHLDQRLQIPVTLIDLQTLHRFDLRRYNVIILPNVYGPVDDALGAHKKALAEWVRQGGTLIAIGRSAAGVAKKSLKLSKVRLRRDVLDKLAVYQAAADRGVASRDISVDARAVWDGIEPPARDGVARVTGGRRGATDKPAASKPTAKGDAGKQLARQRDAWERRFQPRGVLLRGLVDHESWITAGLPEVMPVLLRGSYAFLATEPVRAAVRLAAAPDLRLGGLVWPEARNRLANSVYLTVESVGRGQVILFAYDPVFRGLTQGTARLLSNAVVYGPSMGARQPYMWQRHDR